MHFTEAIFYKLFIPLVVPKTVKRLLYLDTDTLVTADLRELFDTKMSTPLAAVSDTGMPVRSDLGITTVEDYFNAGVMLIDVPAWLSQKITTRSLEFIKQHNDTIITGEQDALNYVLRNNWHKRELKFNFKPLVDLPETPLKSQKSLLKKQAIIHYVGFFKPWTIFDRPAKYLYEFYHSKLIKTPEGKLISDSKVEIDLTNCIRSYVASVEDNVKFALIIAFHLNLLWIRSIEANASPDVRSRLLAYYETKEEDIHEVHLEEIRAAFDENKSAIENLANSTMFQPTTNTPAWEKRWRNLCRSEINKINKKPKGKDLFMVPSLVKKKMMINAKKEELLLFAINQILSKPPKSAYSDQSSS